MVHTPQFNGKQEKVHAMRAGQPELQAQKTFNLRCPRNGKTDECRALGFLKPAGRIQLLFNQPLSVLNTRLGRRQSSSVSPDTGQQGEGARFSMQTRAFLTLMHWRGSW